MTTKSSAPGKDQGRDDEAGAVCRASTLIITNSTTLSSQERADILTLADLCLQRHNAAKARYITGGNVADFWAARAAQQDRQDLLGQVREVGR